MINGDYIMVIAPEDYPGKKYRGRYIYEHHLVWWKHTGEIIKDGELIHHKNENKHDNKFGNLEKITRAEHTSHHAPTPEIMTANCGWCGKDFEGLARDIRHRLKKSMSGEIFCGRSCQVKFQRAHY